MPFEAVLCVNFVRLAPARLTHNTLFRNPVKGNWILPKFSHNFVQISILLGKTFLGTWLLGSDPFLPFIGLSENVTLRECPQTPNSYTSPVLFGLFKLSLKHYSRDKIRSAIAANIPLGLLRDKQLNNPTEAEFMTLSSLWSCSNVMTIITLSEIMVVWCT